MHHSDERKGNIFMNKINTKVSFIVVLSIIILAFSPSLDVNGDIETIKFPILPSGNKTISASVSNKPCVFSFGTLSQSLNNKRTGNNSNEFFITNKNLDITNTVNAAQRIDTFDTNGSYSQIFLNPEYIKYTDETKNLGISILYANGKIKALVGKDVNCHPQLDLITFTDDEFFFVYDTNSLKEIGRIEISETLESDFEVEFLSKIFAFINNDTGRHLYDFINHEYILEDYESIFKTTFGDSDDFIVYHDHLVDLNTQNIYPLEIPEKYLNNKAGTTKIHDDFIDTYIVSSDLESYMIRFDMSGGFVDEFPLEAIGIDQALIIDTSKEYIISYVPHKTIPMRAIGLKVTDLQDYAEYIIPYSIYTYCEPIDIDDEYIYLSGKNGFFKINHETKEVSVKHKQLYTSKPAVFQKDENLFVVYPESVKDDSKLIAYPIDNDFQIDPSKSFTVENDFESGFAATDELAENISEKFGKSFCHKNFETETYHGGHIISDSGEVIQNGLGAWEFLKECDDYLIGLSKEWKFFGTLGNTLCRFEPCQTFSLKKLDSQTDDEVRFEIVATGNGGIFDGKAYLVPWSNNNSSSTPRFAKLGEAVPIKLLPGMKEIITLNTPEERSLINSTNETNESRCFALIIESNGLLDIKNSELSEIDDRVRPLFDGTPISFEEQKAVSLTMWEVE